MNRRVLLLTLVIGLAIAVGGYAAQVQTASHVAATAHVQTKSHTVAPQIVVFYKTGCSHCVHMEEVLTALLYGHPNIKVARYEIDSPGARGLLNRLAFHYKILPTQVPVVFVGNKAIVGWTTRAQEFALRAAVSDCVTKKCPSPLDYASGPTLPWNDIMWLGVILGAFLVFFLIQR